MGNIKIVKRYFRKHLKSQFYTENDSEFKDLVKILKKKDKQALSKGDVSGSVLPEGWLDWNTLSLNQMVEYLRNKYMFSSSGDAKCIYHLIEFYDKHKEHYR